MSVRIGFIGAGRVAYGLARAWYAVGYPISMIASRTRDHAEALAAEVRASVGEAANVVTASDVVFLTVSDDAIATVAQSLADIGWQGTAAVHTSGAMELDVLGELTLAGASVASFHPAFPFADRAISPEALRGMACAIETPNETLRDTLITLAAAIDARPIVIPTGKKAIYHLALVMASNYTVTLYAIAQRLLHQIGADDDVAASVLQPLMQATVENLATASSSEALTGPLVRGDVQTIQRHLDAIDDDTLRRVYKDLAQLSYPMLTARGIDTTPLDELLQD